MNSSKPWPIIWVWQNSPLPNLSLFVPTQLATPIACGHPYQKIPAHNMPLPLNRSSYLARQTSITSHNYWYIYCEHIQKAHEHRTDTDCRAQVVCVSLETVNLLQNTCHSPLSQQPGEQNLPSLNQSFIPQIFSEHCVLLKFYQTVGFERWEESCPLVLCMTLASGDNGTIQHQTCHEVRAFDRLPRWC